MEGFLLGRFLILRGESLFIQFTLPNRKVKLKKE